MQKFQCTVSIVTGSYYFSCSFLSFCCLVLLSAQFSCFDELLRKLTYTVSLYRSATVDKRVFCGCRKSFDESPVWSGTPCSSFAVDDIELICCHADCENLSPSHLLWFAPFFMKLGRFQDLQPESPPFFLKPGHFQDLLPEFPPFLLKLGHFQDLQP